MSTPRVMASAGMCQNSPHAPLLRTLPFLVYIACLWTAAIDFLLTFTTAQNVGFCSTNTLILRACFPTLVEFQDLYRNVRNMAL